MADNTMKRFTDQLNLGNAIRFLRSNKSISSRALSSMSGLSPSYIGKVESGDLNPSFDAFCAIAKALNMSDTEVLFLVRLNQKVLHENQRIDAKDLDGVSASG